ncbi:restriction endonuclease subunit S [Methylomonas sp. MED-D]|uniref:restriction endonuclease subunit S n=1 Tax=Methylomonas sp. MED-D TaxID=3418768 RepID=UPI003CFD9462
MTYPAYPQYKDSGVAWLGDVPKDWEVKRGRFSMSVNPPSPKMRGLEPDAEVSFLPMDAISEYGGLRRNETKIKADVGGGYTEFQDGDVVIAKITPCFENGKGSLVSDLLNSVAYGTTELHVLRTFRDLDNRFLFYITITHGFRKLGESEMYGAGGQKRVPPEFCKDFRIPLPPIGEQTTIADFLDSETGRIDTLVAKKRKLVELLKEKRSALISRTVTRGLPADAAREFGLNTDNIAVHEAPASYGRGDFNRPQAEANKLAPTSERPSVQAFKDSGVEWLGEIPSHWHVMPLFRITSLIQTGPFGSQLHASDYVEGGIPLINPAQIVGGKLVPDELCCVDESTADRLQRHKLQAGDIVMGRRGEIGRCALVTTAESGWICGTGSLLIRFINSDATYFSKVISNSGFVGVLELNAVGTTMLNLNPTIVGRMLVPAPTLQEQTAIATYLDRETAKIDRLVAKVETAITRLQEYRSALITAAVTGKIDVRGAL